jgi:pimeloyl-ACP methyl ester carboxylesterase
MLTRVNPRTHLLRVGMVSAVLALAAGWSPPVGAARSNPRQGSFAGRISIGAGRELYLRCAGRGSPTVLLDSGIHDSSDLWTVTQTQFPVLASPSVFQGVARFTHVCIYDRPGTLRQTQPSTLTTRSTPAPMPRKLPDMAADIHKLLLSAGLRAAVVIVGHSMGGLIDRYFAQRYRKQVRGMVLVDAFGTNIRRLFGSLWPRYQHLVNFPGTPLENLPGWETLDINGAIRDVQRASPLPRIPLAVISKTAPFATQPGFPKDVARRLERVWPEIQDRLVSLEPQTPHIFATGSDHYVQVHDPDLTTSVTRLIFDRVRRHR